MPETDEEESTPKFDIFDDSLEARTFIKREWLCHIKESI